MNNALNATRNVRLLDRFSIWIGGVALGRRRRSLRTRCRRARRRRRGRRRSRSRGRRHRAREVRGRRRRPRARWRHTVEFDVRLFVVFKQSAAVERLRGRLYGRRNFVLQFKIFRGRRVFRHGNKCLRWTSRHLRIRGYHGRTRRQYGRPRRRRRRGFRLFRFPSALHFAAKRNKYLFVHILHDAADGLLVELRFFGERLRKFVGILNTHEKEHYFPLKNARLVNAQAVLRHQILRDERVLPLRKILAYDRRQGLHYLCNALVQTEFLACWFHTRLRSCTTWRPSRRCASTTTSGGSSTSAACRSCSSCRSCPGRGTWTSCTFKSFPESVQIFVG